MKSQRVLLCSTLCHGYFTKKIPIWQLNYFIHFHPFYRISTGIKHDKCQKTGFSFVLLTILGFLAIKNLIRISSSSTNSTPVWDLDRLRPPTGFQQTSKKCPEMYDLPCTNIYNTRGYSVGHFDTSLWHGGLGDPLDAGKHALQLLSWTFCLFSRGSDNLMPITDRY